MFVCVCAHETALCVCPPCIAHTYRLRCACVCVCVCVCVCGWVGGGKVRNRHGVVRGESNEVMADGGDQRAGQQTEGMWRRICSQSQVVLCVHVSLFLPPAPPLFCRLLSISRARRDAHSPTCMLSMSLCVLASIHQAMYSCYMRLRGSSSQGTSIMLLRACMSHPR